MEFRYQGTAFTGLPEYIDHRKASRLLSADAGPAYAHPVDGWILHALNSTPVRGAISHAVDDARPPAQDTHAIDDEYVY